MKEIKQIESIQSVIFKGERSAGQNYSLRLVNDPAYSTMPTPRCFRNRWWYANEDRISPSWRHRSKWMSSQ